MASWPVTKQSFSEEKLKLPIQINGKTRSLIDVYVDEKKDSVTQKAMKDPKVIKNLQNKEVLKIIYVKNKIINFVLK